MLPWSIALALLVAPPARVPSVAPQELARIWDPEHVSPPLPPLLEHDEVERRMQGVSQGDPSRFIFERVGASLEGRSINMITTGTGPFRVLLWSQMHGDEPTAAAALFDVFDYFQRHRDDPLVLRILSSLTLYVVPMLNPDGAERFQRRNAQGIDVDLPDWSKQPSTRVITTGQPAEIVLMRPLGDPSRPASRYVIQTILKY